MVDTRSGDRETQLCRCPWRKWGRWLAFVALAYLVLWGVTWLFGPNAVVRLFASHYATKTDSDGKQIPIEFHTDAKFAGEAMNFFPDPVPEVSPWCCVGSPSVLAPFLITTKFAYHLGPFAGGGGYVVFLWTPWGLYEVYHKYEWVE